MATAEQQLSANYDQQIQQLHQLIQQAQAQNQAELGRVQGNIGQYGQTLGQQSQAARGVIDQGFNTTSNAYEEALQRVLAGLQSYGGVSGETASQMALGRSNLEGERNRANVYQTQLGQLSQQELAQRLADAQTLGSNANMQLTNLMTGRENEINAARASALQELRNSAAAAAAARRRGGGGGRGRGGRSSGSAGAQFNLGGGNMDPILNTGNIFAQQASLANRINYGAIDPRKRGIPTLSTIGLTVPKKNTKGVSRGNGGRSF